jgi:hypothetical protein
MFVSAAADYLPTWPVCESLLSGHGRIRYHSLFFATVDKDISRDYGLRYAHVQVSFDDHH